jgi:hypothetical protein
MPDLDYDYNQIGKLAGTPPPFIILANHDATGHIAPWMKDFFLSRTYQSSLTFRQMRHSSQTIKVLSFLLYLIFIHSWIPTLQKKGL